MRPPSLSEPEYQARTAFWKKGNECDKRAEETPSRPIKKHNPIVKQQHVPFATEKFQPKIEISPFYQADFVVAIYGMGGRTIPPCYYRRRRFRCS